MRSRSWLLLLFLFGVIVGSATPAAAHERTWPGKRLAATMPEAKKFIQKQVNLTSAQVEWIQKALGEPVRTEDQSPYFYVGINRAGKSMGVVVFLDATGENGKIEMGLALDLTGAVMHVLLLDHSERDSVTTKAFLRQFIGKRAADKFKVGGDVKAPADAAVAAQVIATATRRGLLLAMAGLRVGAK